MKKIRINELARELEVKAHEILDKLPELGVADKKTHSSSIDDDVADKLRVAFGHEPLGESGAPTEVYAGGQDESASDDEKTPETVTAGPAVTAPAAPVTEEAQTPAPVEEKADGDTQPSLRPAHPIRPPLAGQAPVR